MTGILERELSIVLLSFWYDILPFDSGDPELNDFLKHDALCEQIELLSVMPWIAPRVQIPGSRPQRGRLGLLREIRVQILDTDHKTRYLH